MCHAQLSPWVSPLRLGWCQLPACRDRLEDGPSLGLPRVTKDGTSLCVLCCPGADQRQLLLTYTHCDEGGLGIQGSAAVAYGNPRLGAGGIHTRCYRHPGALLCLPRSCAYLLPPFLPSPPVQVTVTQKQWGRSSLCSAHKKGTSHCLLWGRGNSVHKEEASGCDGPCSCSCSRRC